MGKLVPGGIPNNASSGRSVSKCECVCEREMWVLKERGTDRGWQGNKKPDFGNKTWDRICSRRFGGACTYTGATERKHTIYTPNQILNTELHLNRHISLWIKRQTKIKQTVNQQPVRETKRSACMYERTPNSWSLTPQPATPT